MEVEHNFRFYSETPEGDPDIPAICSAFLSAYPDRERKSVERYIPIAIETALQFEELDFDFKFLFELIRNLQANTKPRFRSSKYAAWFAPYSFVFAEAMTAMEKINYNFERIDWADEEQVEILFLDTWPKVRRAAGESLLGEALTRAEHNPLEFKEPPQNSQLRRFLSLAYYLQQEQGNVAILLPIHKVAPFLDVSPQFVSSLITLALKDKYLYVVDANYNQAEGKAKQFGFNVNHPNIGIKKEPVKRKSTRA